MFKRIRKLQKQQTHRKSLGGEEPRAALRAPPGARGAPRIISINSISTIIMIIIISSSSSSIDHIDSSNMNSSTRRSSAPSRTSSRGPPAPRRG